MSKRIIHVRNESFEVGAIGVTMKTLLILLTFALPLAIPVLGNPNYVNQPVMFDQYLFEDRLKTKTKD